MVEVPRFGWRRQLIPAHLRRRLLAALLALAAAVLALSSLHPTKPSTARPPSTTGRSAADPLTARLGADQVAAPVRLIDPQVGGLLQAGASVDVLAAAPSETGPDDAAQSPARVIAHGVRVLAVPASTPSEGSAGGTLVVLAVSQDEAQVLAGAEAGGRLSVVLLAR